MEEKYFAAVNSRHGFVSFYGDAFGAARRVFIIKGGPGTGKSYFMRRVAERCEACGLPVTYIYCSSDPSSLDGITVGDRAALLDGTAPHATEASLPGARDELIDLGRFWQSDGLFERRDGIEALAKSKSLHYSTAYRALAAAGELEDASLSLALPCLNTKKLAAAARRYLSPFPDGGGFKKTDLATSSLGMRGAVRFSTLEDRARSVISVSDELGLGHLFLDAVIKEAERRGMPIRISHEPLCPDRADAVEMTDTGTVFSLHADKAGRHVNMKRFIDLKRAADLRREYRALRSCRDSTVDAALAEL
ncbi:MAG: hypothetical protein IJX46_05455 [Clostridia bacterium]|nr:hypothetical protein [Clostridia bacterium]